MCAVVRNSHSHGDLWFLVEMGWYGVWSKCAQAQVPLHRWVGGQKRVLLSLFGEVFRVRLEALSLDRWMDGWNDKEPLDTNAEGHWIPAGGEMAVLMVAVRSKGTGLPGVLGWGRGTFRCLWRESIGRQVGRMTKGFQIPRFLDFRRERPCCEIRPRTMRARSPRGQSQGRGK